MNTRKTVPPPPLRMPQPQRHPPDPGATPVGAPVRPQPMSPVQTIPPAVPSPPLRWGTPARPMHPQRAGVGAHPHAAVPSPPVERPGTASTVQTPLATAVRRHSASLKVPTNHLLSQGVQGRLANRFALSAAMRSISIQKMEQQEVPKATFYGSLLLTYSEEEIKLAADQLGIGDSYTGHLSQHPGASVSGTTMLTQQKLAAKCAENRQKAKEEKKQRDPDEVRDQEKDAEYQQVVKITEKKAQKSAHYGKKPAEKTKKSAEEVTVIKCKGWYGANKNKPGNPVCPYCGKQKNSHR